MNGFALNNIQNAYVGSTPAQAIYLGSTLIWPTTPHDYSQDYLTIVSLEDNNEIKWKYVEHSVSPAGWNRTISISTDDGSTWTSYTSTSAGITLATLNSGDKLLIKGSNNNYSNGRDYNRFESSNYINVQGNIMSLLYEDNFIGQTTIFSNCAIGLFNNNTKLVNAENLILPATTLADDCYEGMFYGCTALTAIPELPATTLASGCYESMFKGCTSLTTAPELSATTLGRYCYSEMFEGCTSLTTAPELSATTLKYACYSHMFRGCTSLTIGPELPATTLAEHCYQYMFFNCTNLNYIKCLATDISATLCTYYWVDRVASSGTFVKAASMTSWTTGTDGIPSGWTVIDT